MGPEKEFIPVYDADETFIEITASEDSIEIKDNVAGMDREGLRQYFNIG
jgi:hypothetical protein